jgi:outer membrane protein OmpA-like peptidoglycan-associated protein
MVLIKKISFFLFLILNSSFLISQNADCNNLLELKDTIYHAKNIVGYGKKIEFSGNELDNKRAFEEEKNSIWYLITAPASGVFTFDIVADNPKDDWDFMLYRKKNMFCKRIDSNKINPLRTNLSRSPKTGLSLTANENYVGAGINEAYSKYLNVKKGDQYVLVVNNPKRTGGNHTLILHFPKSNDLEPIKVIKEPQPLTIFIVSVRDKLTLKPVESNMKITGLSDEVLSLTSVSSHELEIAKKNRDVNVITSAKGYMINSIMTDVSKNKSKVNVDVLLDPITAGAKINLKRIQFYGNRFDLLPTAKPSLDALLAFLELNPTVFIEVEGHVNGPRQKNSKSYKELSYNRAYAVKDYLISHGITKERVDFTGYGNTKMLFPDARSEYQQSANRRVEIKILSK